MDSGLNILQAQSMKHFPNLQVPHSHNKFKKEEPTTGLQSGIFSFVLEVSFKSYVSLRMRHSQGLFQTHKLSLTQSFNIWLDFTINSFHVTGVFVYLLKT